MGCGSERWMLNFGRNGHASDVTEELKQLRLAVERLIGLLEERAEKF